MSAEAGSAVRALALLLVTGAVGTLLTAAGAEPPPLAKPATRSIVSLSGTLLAGLFDGQEPNSLFSLRNIQEHRRPPAKCSVKGGADDLNWIDRFLGVTVVHAAIWCESHYYRGGVPVNCNNSPPDCKKQILSSTQYDPLGASYYGGFDPSPTCCNSPLGCSCGMAWAFCVNEGGPDPP